MKALWIAVTVLLLLTALVVGNCIYVGRLTDSLLEAANALPDFFDVKQDGFETAAEGAKQFGLRWEKHREVLALFVHFDYLVAITQSVVSLEQFALSGETGEYTAARELLIESLLRLQGTEALSLDNIL